MLRHTTIEIDGICLDLLLTEEEISLFFERALSNENYKYIDLNKSCKSWSLVKPKNCSIWKKILRICRLDD
jgi:hypothetical protein